MKNKTLSFLLSCFAGSVFYLGFGWMVFDLILGDYTESHTVQLIGFKKNIDFTFLYLSCLSYSVLITFYLLKAKITSPKKAFLSTAVIGFLIACMTDLYWYASSYYYSNLLVVILDVCGAAISVGALGALNYLTLRKSKFSS